MAAKPLSQDLMQEAIDAVARAGGSVEEAMKASGLARNTFRGRVDRARHLGIKPSKGLTDYTDPDDLRRQVKALASELKSATDKALTEDAIRDHIITLRDDARTTETPKWLLNEGTKKESPGVPTLQCSDWHCGEVVHSSQVNGVNKYNMAIFNDRVRVLADSTVHLLRILDDKLRYPGIVIPLGGDMCSGNIHDELTATNELNSMPVVLELFATLKWLIGAMAEKFGAVFLPCVTGNHGRDTQKIWNKDRHATSFDWLLYMLLAKHFEGDKRIVFQIPDGPDAYYRVFGHRYLLTHGDQFRGGDGMIGALGPILRGDHKKRSRNSAIDMEYDTLVMGHFHQEIFLRKLIVNSSLKGYDEYAYNNNFSFEPPSQNLWITHPKHHITYRMPVFVDEARAPAKTSWVSFAK